MSDFAMDLGPVFGGTDFTTSLPEIDLGDVFENTLKLGPMNHVETNGNLFRPIDTEPTLNLFQRTNTTIPLTPGVLDPAIDDVQFPEAETQPWQRPILPELFDHLAGDLGTMLQPADDLAHRGSGRRVIVPDMNLLVAQYTPPVRGAPKETGDSAGSRYGVPMPEGFQVDYRGAPASTADGAATGHSSPITQPTPFVPPNYGGYEERDFGRNSATGGPHPTPPPVEVPYRPDR